MMDYSDDEDTIVITSKKRKVLDEYFPTNNCKRQYKRIRVEQNDLYKLRDIPESSFDIRSTEEQDRIIDDIIGIDEEAYKFLMEAYDNLCDDPEYSSILEGSSKGSEDVNRAHLPFKTVAKPQKKKGMDKKDDISDSPGWWKGCSRCDGFPREKDGSKVWKGDKVDEVDLTKAPVKSTARVKGPSRSDFRGEQRRFALTNAETSGLAVTKFMFSSLQIRSKNLRFSLSKIHKWGLFACEKIANGAAVIEYVGEKIRPSLADHREKVYAALNTHDGNSYFFRVGVQVIDASLKGNKARFINHSCNPNCIAKVIRHDNGQGNAKIEGDAGDEMMDYSDDEDTIVKTSKKRKVLDENFPTKRQYKRIRVERNVLDKLRDIPESSFDIRSTEEQDRIIDDIIGIDEEAYKFLMEAYDNMCDDLEYSSILESSSKGSDDVNRAHLPFKTVAKPQKKKGMDKKDDISDSPGWWKGCSRCDGFPREKDGSKVWKGDKVDEEDLTKAPIKSTARVKASSRSDFRGEQRRFALTNAETSSLAVTKFMFSSLQIRSKNLRFSLSKIHKWGLFACENIANGAAVIEYVGERIRLSLADHRERVYAALNTHDGNSYFFRVDDRVIDATLKGNKARFINHSCNPNCIAKVIRHDNGHGNAIVIYASKTIEEDEEITYDYKFPREDLPESEKIRCNCRASNCQIYLN